MNSWHSYPSIFALGHKAIEDLLNDEVIVEEKVDGSQFSFGVFPCEFNESTHVIDEVPHVLKVRSKGAIMNIDAPQSMFKEAVDHVKARVFDLAPGFTYRGECLKKPKHNALAYDRTPAQNVIIFDINSGEEEYLSYEQKALEANRLGFEVVPLLFSGKLESVSAVRRFLDTTSVLGGQKIEGVVVKPIKPKYGWDKKLLIGKFVSEAFKEVHSNSWKESNPTSTDILQQLGEQYGTAARWNKAVQHLSEAGKLESSPRDIGLLINEIPNDILSDSEDDIKAKLFTWAWPHIKRMVIKGFPQFYKEKLLASQFEKEDK